MDPGALGDAVGLVSGVSLDSCFKNSNGAPIVFKIVELRQIVNEAAAILEILGSPLPSTHKLGC